ncbi:hypothetical protein BGZ46_005454 [Entomortierella lignicola]|nr:hypothetical protein BGZ46_005454 [Entomortierella lignicola]
MTKPETAAAADAATSRRSNRAKPSTETKAKTEPETTSENDEVVKRRPGRPPGSSNKNAVKKVETEPKTPGRRGRPRTVNIDQDAKSKEKVVTTPGKRGRKRKLDADGSSLSTPAKKPTTDDSGVPRKRGRPAGTGKKQATTEVAPAVPVVPAKPAAPAKPVASAKPAVSAPATEAPVEEKGDDDSGAFSGIKLTIERCSTCTQYHKNVVRIFKVTNELYPLALTQEEVVPNSKSFEIYLSNNGSKNKLIWSGKAHAPPKRLAFPDSDVFVKLLKNELKDK